MIATNIQHFGQDVIYLRDTIGQNKADVEKVQSWVE